MQRSSLSHLLFCFVLRKCLSLTVLELTVQVRLTQTHRAMLASVSPTQGLGMSGATAPGPYATLKIECVV